MWDPAQIISHVRSFRCTCRSSSGINFLKKFALQKLEMQISGESSVNHLMPRGRFLEDLTKRKDYNFKIKNGFSIYAGVSVMFDLTNLEKKHSWCEVWPARHGPRSTAGCRSPTPNAAALEAMLWYLDPPPGVFSTPQTSRGHKNLDSPQEFMNFELW